MFMTTVECWETAWTEYVEALDNYDADWSGPDFVQDIARAAYRLQDAENVLRTIDPELCAKLDI